MSNYIFRPAIRENVNLIIGVVGPSGGGKTYSAMMMATGLSAGKRFAVIDTEARRALHYADRFQFDHTELRAPFLPDAYTAAITAAETAKYPVVVVDSCSHEWAGEGGILDWQETELDRMAGQDYRKREACKMASWIKPKMSHKQMVQKLLQVNAHLILCFRAEEKVGIEKDQNNKTVIVPKGWQPICEKNMPYELTMSFLLTPDQPGIGHPIKLQEQHRVLFNPKLPIDDKFGKNLLLWSSVSQNGPAESHTINDPTPTSAPVSVKNEMQPETTTTSDTAITKSQRKKLYEMCQEKGMSDEDIPKFKAFVLEDGKETKEWASDFISNFDKYYNLYQEQMK